MGYFTWKDSYSVGHPSLDHDHQRLGQIINALYDAVHQNSAPQGISQILTALRRYVENHFAREERLLQAINYPDYEHHIVSHRRIEQTLADFENLYATSPEGVDAVALLDFLKRWLLTHILKDDMHYRTLILQNAALAASAVHTLQPASSL